MKPTFEWPDAVVILSNRDDVVAGLEPGFYPEFTGPNQVRWFEGNHERIFEVKTVVQDSPEKFVFESVRGDRFELLPMTLELYREHVKDRTIGERDFETLDELMAAMRREW